MLKTENLELNIIEGTDIPNHAVFNENANKIDEFAKNTNEKLTNTSLKIENINNTITNLGEVNNTQNESISSLRTDLVNVENDVMSLNEKNTNLSARLETVETDVLSLNVKSIKGGTSFHTQNSGNFSRTTPKLIELSNAVTDNNFKDVLQSRNNFEFSFKNNGKYHLTFNVPVQVTDADAIGYLKINLCKYPYTNGSISSPNISDVVIKGFVELSGNLTIDAIIDVTNINDYYGFVLSASAYKEGYILTEDDNDKLSTLYVERIS